jgi:hypothetical protein
MEDVVTNYKWTTTQGSYKEEAPRVFATSYGIDSNAIVDAIKSYYSIGASATFENKSGVDYYNDLHKTTDKEQFVFPYFSDDIRNFNNAWGDSYVGSTNGSDTGVGYGNTLKDAADKTINLVSQINALKEGSPGALFEPPKFYSYQQDEGAVTVSFILINTDDEKDIVKNYNLVTKLINDNRFTRKDGNPLLVTPPKLWSVIVPGYRAIRWASCGVSVNLLGARRYMYLAAGKKLIPEGYNVTLTFTPLYTEPSNFSSFYDKTGF